MFKKSLNRAVLRLKITTETPLFIKAGDSGLDPAASDLACVRTRHANLGSTVYIPGSSLRGVVRSSAEAAVRGHTWSGVQGACDPLEHNKTCIARWLRQAEKAQDSKWKPSTAEIHANHCLACRLFGSTQIKARAAVRDLFPWDPEADSDSTQRDECAAANRTELRNGVAINRLSGAVQHGPFDQEMVPAGVSFWGDIALENFQAWQLGLLATGIDEINEGNARLGSSKSRGLGAASVGVIGMRYEQSVKGGQTPAGVGVLDSAAQGAYGLLPDRAFPDAGQGKPRGLALRWSLTGAQAAAWLDAGREALGQLA